jgi:cell division protein FtsL
MARVKLTVSLPEEVVIYLRSTPNMSSTIAEAVIEYQARQLEAELEQAYREDAAEAEELNREWENVDAEPAE